MGSYRILMNIYILVCSMMKYVCIKCSGIGGQEDMRHICGIIVAKEKAKLAKEDKVIIFNL